MNKVKFGIIGAGNAWHFHSVADKGSEYISYTAVYNHNFEKAKQAVAEYKDGVMKPCAGLDELLGADIDAVLVMAPHVNHEEIVTRCAKAGKHILCEKPMATTVEACRRMIKICHDAKIKFMIAENHRFLPAHIYMHDVVQQGLIGDVLMIRGYEGVNELESLSDPNSWKGDPLKAGGGSFMDMAAHKFAVIEYILGFRCTKVIANLAKQAFNVPGKTEDNAVAIAYFENDAIADIMVSFSQITLPYNTLEIFGTRGSILENHDWVKPVRFCSFDERMGDKQQKWLEPDIRHGPFPEYYNISLREEDEHFARCILESREPEFSPEEAMHSVTDILAGYLSAEQGRPVETVEIEKLADAERSIDVLKGLIAAVPLNKRLVK
ncbi:MAG: Gfo/Idh/MocA family oxidoreductase [Treponema sp.]|jgi:predicted dehydrogenase|nr:Gfo/Idh/MocA family oxidoreductase [Treponema sp.]